MKAKSCSLISKLSASTSRRPAARDSLLNDIGSTGDIEEARTFVSENGSQSEIGLEG